MESQSARSVLLVRPASFGFNAEAARSNAFAQASADSELQRKALGEFDTFAARLFGAGVEVIVLDDNPEPAKPDAIFPNNWFSTHADGTMVLYPMATSARRPERRVDEVRKLIEWAGFQVRRTVDLSGHEKHDRFLEGTGSLVLDRRRRRAYANFSPRTQYDVIAEFDRKMAFSTFTFDASDRSGRPIYHTNVLLSIGSEFATLCVDAVERQHRDALVAEIRESGRTIVELDFSQLRAFGCNMLELRSSSGDPLIALSATALRALRPDQRRTLERFGGLVAADIPTIEKVGGGSVRCMIAEIHLPRA